MQSTVGRCADRDRSAETLPTGLAGASSAFTNLMKELIMNPCHPMITRAAGLTVIAMVMIGCHQAPTSFDPAASESALAAEEYWQAVDIDQIHASPVRRVIITEFNVEFVKDRLTSMNSQGESVVGAPDLTGVSLIGLGRQQLALDLRTKSVMAGDLYWQFVRLLQSAGYEVVTKVAIRASEQYQQFHAAQPGSGSLLTLFNIVGTDTGTPKQFEVYPAHGLKAITGVDGVESVEEAEQRLLDELDADLSLRVRFRVGLYGAHATVEAGSLIRAATRSGAGGLVARRSLVNTDPVVANSEFQLLAGEVYTVDSLVYRQSVAQVFDAYAGMAIEQLGPADQTDRPLRDSPVNAWISVRSSNTDSGQVSADVDDVPWCRESSASTAQGCATEEGPQAVEAAETGCEATASVDP
jgi:hypothetical protein